MDTDGYLNGLVRIKDMIIREARTSIRAKQRNFSTAIRISLTLT